MKIRNVLLIMLLIAGNCAWASGEHWTWNPYQYADNATFISVLTIDGVEQRSEDLEIGAFCDGECRGSYRCEYEPRKDRYFAYLTVNGETGMMMTFKLWDHVNQTELDVTCDITYTFVPDGYYGLPREPYIFPFTSNYSGVVFNGNVDMLWSNPLNWSDNTLPGITSGVTINSDCMLDIDAAVASLTMGQSYVLTLQSGTTLTVTGTLANTDTEGLVIKEGAQLVNASGNVAATMEKDIIAYNDENPDGWYIIASPMDEMPIAGSDFLTPEYDLYRFNETNLTQEEWENYKANLADFTTFENGRGYLYANSNSFSPAFTGTLNAVTITCPLTYTERPYDDFDGFNLIGNPFPHNIYKGTGGAIDNSCLASGYYTLTNEGTWHVHGYGEAIQPGQGILVKTTVATNLDIAKGNAVASSESGAGRQAMNVTVTGETGTDRIIVYFGEGIGLNKIENFSTEEPILSVQGEDGEYAIAHVDADCESLDLLFNSGRSGEYKLSVSMNEVVFSYLHLIDSETGSDFDLLETPYYTFQSTGHEDANRFTLLFMNITGVEESQTSSFCFVKDGILYFLSDVENVNITMTDVLGRIVKSEKLKGNQCSLADLQMGVYVVSMNDGSAVKMQKIVLR